MKTSAFLFSLSMTNTFIKLIFDKSKYSWSLFLMFGHFFLLKFILFLFHWSPYLVLNLSVVDFNLLWSPLKLLFLLVFDSFGHHIILLGHSWSPRFDSF